MNKDQIIILENRGLISISGEDSEEFLQNIITNDIFKINEHNSLFSAILSPQGKYLYEFFLIRFGGKFFLDCNETIIKNLIDHLTKFKLSSKVDIKNETSGHVIGIITLEKFYEISDNKVDNTFQYRDSPIFVDPREKKLGARILSTLEKIHLTIKKLKLKITDSNVYLEDAYKLGIPEKGLENLKDQLFGLEANFEQLNAIDFKKGCYIGQENTARMKLKNKLRKKLVPIKAYESLNVGDELKYNNLIIGKILINKPYPFALIKMFDPDFNEFKNKDLLVGNKKCKILNSLKQS